MRLQLVSSTPVIKGENHLIDGGVEVGDHMETVVDDQFARFLPDTQVWLGTGVYLDRWRMHWVSKYRLPTLFSASNPSGLKVQIQPVAVNWFP